MQEIVIIVDGGIAEWKYSSGKVADHVARGDVCILLYAGGVYNKGVARIIPFPAALVGLGLVRDQAVFTTHVVFHDDLFKAEVVPWKIDQGIACAAAVFKGFYNNGVSGVLRINNSEKQDAGEQV